jgi:hypothetical protein
MDDKDISAVLKIMLEPLNTRKTSWRLDGSANLKVQGIDINVNDIDIMTDEKSYISFKNRFKKYYTDEGYDEKKKKHYLMLMIAGNEVEIAHYDDPLIVMLDKIKMIEWKGLKLSILPLVHAKKFYELIGKDEKAKLIEKYLHP